MPRYGGIESHVQPTRLGITGNKLDEPGYH